MGGVISAASVAYSRSEGKTVEEMTKAVFRASVMGGITLCSVSLLSAWSCTVAAKELSNTPSAGPKARVPIERAMNVQAKDCLLEHGHELHMKWAMLAFVTALVGIAAARNRSKTLGTVFLALFALRGAACLGNLALATYDPNSCAAWTLTKTYWEPLISLTCVVSFGGLALKFVRVMRAIDTAGGLSGAGQGVDMSVLDITKDLGFDNDNTEDKNN